MSLRHMRPLLEEAKHVYRAVGAFSVAYLEMILGVIRLGFTSVMFDGSRVPYEQNVRMTRDVIAAAYASGVDVEAEIGRVGRVESGEESPTVYAAPKEALRFIKGTGVDVLTDGRHRQPVCRRSRGQGHLQAAWACQYGNHL